MAAREELTTLRNGLDMDSPPGHGNAMREADAEQLKQEYAQPVPVQANDSRLNDVLNFGLSHVIGLGDALRDDLDQEKYGIKWWQAYTYMDRKTCIFISDHLVSCARAIATNLIEAYAYRLEYDHAMHDFAEFIRPGIEGSSMVIPPPRSAYDDLSFFRLEASLAGILRALGSGLDCLGATMVGVAGLPIDIVKSSLHGARESLKSQANNTPRLRQLQTEIDNCADSAGPKGWQDWLIAMRNMVVHRGRRVVTFNVDRGPGNQVDFVLMLPRSPELTEVEGLIHAGGQVASLFSEPADAFLTRLTASTYTYVDSMASLLVNLWHERKSNPLLIRQPMKQWREPTGLISPAPTFNGYNITPTGAATGVGVSDDMMIRLRAAGLAHRTAHDLCPDPRIWS